MAAFHRGVILSGAAFPAERRISGAHERLRSVTSGFGKGAASSRAARNKKERGFSR